MKYRSLCLSATCTVMALDTGTVVLLLHTLRFVDDFNHARAHFSGGRRARVTGGTVVNRHGDHGVI